MRCLVPCSDFPLGGPLIFCSKKDNGDNDNDENNDNSLGEISTFIGWRNTFHRLRVALSTSPLLVVGRASALGRIQYLVRRVDYSLLEQ